VPVFILFVAAPAAFASPDLGPVARVFLDCPLGWDPVIECVEFNGQPEVRMTFKTRTPFELLTEYYRGLLAESGWKAIDFQRAFAIAKRFMPEQSVDAPRLALFVSGKHIVQILYPELEKQKFYVVILRELMPAFFLNPETTEIHHVDGIALEEARPTMQFSSRLLNYHSLLLLTFETRLDESTVMRYYGERLIDRQWKRIGEWKALKGEMQRLPVSANVDALNKVDFFQKDGARTLFLFASTNPKTKKTTFGYLLKEIR
jgi:hypothetical protein